MNLNAVTFARHQQSLWKRTSGSQVYRCNARRLCRIRNWPDGLRIYRWIRGRWRSKQGRSFVNESAMMANVISAWRKVPLSG